jgi:sigma-E factor negative regulatory protein RseC
MKEEGIVVDTIGEIAKVRVERMEVCAGCQACFRGRKNLREIFAVNTVGAKVGERVYLEVSSHELLRGAFLIYIFPIILLILGFIIGGLLSALLGLVELRGKISAVVGIVFLFGAFPLIYLHNRFIGKKFRPQIVQVLNRESGVSAR